MDASLELLFYRGPPVGPLRVDNSIISDPGEISEVFADYFGSIYISAVSDARS